MNDTTDTQAAPGTPGRGPAFLAVDAGNSKTVALVVDSSGLVLGRGRGGRGDIYGAATIEEALDAVFGAIGAALADAGLPLGDAGTPAGPRIASAAFRLAGVDYPEDAEFWDGHFRERFGIPGDGGAIDTWSIKNDGFATLRLLDGTGIAVSITVGTGPAVAARSADGREECSGMFVFDGLGGEGLGNAALEAVCRAWMGIGPATALTDAMREMFDVDDAWELRHSFTRRFGARPGKDLWRAARLVLAVADDGDEVARGIVEHQARAFVQYAEWCARRVGVDLASGELPVLLNGSVATSEHPAMRDAITAELARVAPAVAVTVADAAPLCGVVLDALAEGGIEITPRLLADVRDEHPDSFLMT